MGSIFYKNYEICFNSDFTNKKGWYPAVIKVMLSETGAKTDEDILPIERFTYFETKQEADNHALELAIKWIDQHH